MEQYLGEDNKKKPYKAIAAAVSAGLVSLLSFSDTLPTGAVIAATILVAAIATYLVPNPKV